MDLGTLPALLRLPSAARVRIWRELVEGVRLGGEPISLASSYLLNDVWAPKSFKSLRALHRALRPYLQVSFAFFSEITLTLLTTEYFHMVLSPFTLKSDPLVAHWLPCFSPYIRHIILEVDLSRFSVESLSGDVAPGANKRATHGGTVRIEQFIGHFMKAQHERMNVRKKLHCLNIENIFILCRRYYGNRPVAAQNADTSSEQPQGKHDRAPLHHSLTESDPA